MTLVVPSCSPTIHTQPSNTKAAAITIMPMFDYAPRLCLVQQAPDLFPLNLEKDRIALSKIQPDCCGGPPKAVLILRQYLIPKQPDSQSEYNHSYVA
jgi:hypothetical protein